DSDARGWQGLFLEIGVARLPRVSRVKGGDIPVEWRGNCKLPRKADANPYEHKDYLPSKELATVIKSRGGIQTDLLLRLLDAEWQGVFKGFVDGYLYGRKYNTCDSQLNSSTLIRLLRKMEVRTVDGSIRPLEETFADVPELRKVFGDSLPYLATSLI